MSSHRKWLCFLLVILATDSCQSARLLNESANSRIAALLRSPEKPPLTSLLSSSNNNNNNNKSLNSGSLAQQQPREALFNVHATAIHVEDAEFPLSKSLFSLTLKLALESAKRRLAERSKIKLSLSIRSANTCSRQYAAALAADEYYSLRSRLFIVSGCDDAIRGVSQMAAHWRVPLLTGAGFGADLNNKSRHQTLVRVAFSFRNAVEFLLKILKSFHWMRVNLIADISDTNSVSLKQGIETYFEDYKQQAEFGVRLNVLSLDMHSLINQEQLLAETDSSNLEQRQRQQPNRKQLHQQTLYNQTTSASAVDQWPNQLTETAVRDTLRQSALYSRVSILLIPQNYLRKFMLSVYDANMANGMYTFINIPLLLMATDDSPATGASSPPEDSSLPAHKPSQAQSFSASTGENVFVWRSLGSSRNSQARQAYESLMSIYLRTPTSTAYVYFASKLLGLANSELRNSSSLSSSSALTQHSQTMAARDNTAAPGKLQLNINPYSASFYDSLEMYATALEESMRQLAADSGSNNSSSSSSNNHNRSQLLHARVAQLLRKRRFDNMVTGTVQLNENADRENDYTLDDMNQMTGRFQPVILYKGETRDIERVSRIYWSSDSNVGPTLDNVDCSLTNTCAGKPLPKFFVTLFFLATPLGLVMGSLMYLLYSRISLESQLVDFWWKIAARDIELLEMRRKTGAGSELASEYTGSQVGSSHVARSRARSGAPDDEPASSLKGSELEGPAATSITKATGLTGVTSATALDVCYGTISLGMYKLTKVALKPIPKFSQSRRLMIELRTIKTLDHANLCRFMGIVVDEGLSALVTEYCSKGSLREFLQNETMVIDWTFKYSIINDILAGLVYLHSSDLQFHGRLKSANCLVSSRFVVKLSDYGLTSLSDQIDSAQPDEESLLMKQLWRAPEHLKSSSSSSASKTGSKKGDIYSLALVLYEITTNQLPFFDSSTGEYVLPLKSLYDELKSNGISQKVGINVDAIEAQPQTGSTDTDLQPLKDLMKQCLVFDPSKRPSLLVVSSALKRITKGTTSKKLLENLTSRMEQYTTNLESLVDAKLATLVEEKQRAEELLYQFVPKSIAHRLKEGETIEPEAFECVTVLFSDIVGFTSLSSESTPMQVIDFLSELYLLFDGTLQNYDIFKVETIGDAYIIASGLPVSNEGKHALEIAQAALELRDRLSKFKIAHKPGRSLQMRVGIHSGPCVAGIVGGLNMPKYCVFGDTLSVCKHMESSGVPMKIQITEQTKELLDRIGCFKIEPRTPKIIKDGVPFQSYWLERGRDI